MTVDGPDGAFAWSYQDAAVQVTATAGPGLLVTFGNATGSVTAAQDGAVYSIGVFNGTLTTGRYAGVFAVGGFGGSLTSGSDAAVASEGNVSADMSVGRDLNLCTIRRTSQVSELRYMIIYTYGKFNTDLTTGRDVIWIYSRGDMSGQITAGGNVGALWYTPFG